MPIQAFEDLLHLASGFLRLNNPAAQSAIWWKDKPSIAPRRKQCDLTSDTEASADLLPETAFRSLVPQAAIGGADVRSVLCA
jgi:hypothetical protein